MFVFSLIYHEISLFFKMKKIEKIKIREKNMKANERNVIFS